MNPEQCRNGHIRTPATTYTRPEGDSECRLCRRLKRPPVKKGKKRMTAIERFYRAVNKTTTCWIWSAHSDRNGYGLFFNGRTILAHRYSYQIHKGPIPSGSELHHTCENKSCVNPDHLTCVTRLEHKQLHA